LPIESADRIILWESFLWAVEVILKKNTASRRIQYEEPMPLNATVWWVKRTKKDESLNDMLRGSEDRGFLEKYWTMEVQE
jgi:hypothetical protein